MHQYKPPPPFINSDSIYWVPSTAKLLLGRRRLKIPWESRTHKNRGGTGASSLKYGCDKDQRASLPQKPCRCCPQLSHLLVHLHSSALLISHYPWAFQNSSFLFLFFNVPFGTIFMIICPIFPQTISSSKTKQRCVIFSTELRTHWLLNKC